MRKSGFKPYFKTLNSQYFTKITKIWLLSLVWSIFSFSWFSSANTYNNCSLFSKGMPTTIIENLKKDPIVTSSAIPIEAIEKAVENLHSYCCSSEILSKTTKSCIETKNKREKNPHVPESAALFDQFVDMQMRRWTNDLTNYQGVLPDKNFADYLKKLNDIMLDPKGVFPQVFLSEYRKYWSYNDQEILPTYKDQSPHDFLQSTRTSPALTKVSSRTLRSKLLNTCSIATYLTIMLDSSAEKLVPDLTIAAPRCASLLNQHIQKQMDLLSRIITYKSNKASNDAFQDYAITYFSSRLNFLQTQIDKTNIQLLSTFRQIPYLIPKCN